MSNMANVKCPDDLRCLTQKDGTPIPPSHPQRKGEIVYKATLRKKQFIILTTFWTICYLTIYILIEKTEIDKVINNTPIRLPDKPEHFVQQIPHVPFLYHK